MKNPHHITQAEMATFLGESQQYINLLIKNLVNPRPNKIKKFSLKTNTSLSFWITASGVKKERAIKSAMKKQKLSGAA